MEVVIEINEEQYKQIAQENEVGFNLTSPIDALIASVKHGTPLPKGHGRLIDKDEVLPKIHGVKSIHAVVTAPTIIEADKESD